MPRSAADLSSHDCLFYPQATGASVWPLERKTSRKAASEHVTFTVNGPLSANNSKALRDAAVERIETVNVATINVSTRDHTATTFPPSLTGKRFPDAQ
jgi:hypothetical protein